MFAKMFTTIKDTMMKNYGRKINCYDRPTKVQPVSAPQPKFFAHIGDCPACGSTDLVDMCIHMKCRCGWESGTGDYIIASQNRDERKA